MLRKVTEDRPKDWDRCLPAVLFAFREVRQESTEYSPFEMVYGRLPRGPIEIWKDILKSSKPIDDEIPVFQYLSDLRERLSTALNIANASSDAAAARARYYKNKNSRTRHFEVGGKVLLLLPTNHNKLLLTWRGPYLVLRKVSEVDYEIDVHGLRKTFHVNMLQTFMSDHLTFAQTAHRQHLLSI
ncbi:transposon Tf2-11 polyprotein [Elysia marginata]|uniref:Transposon Tf2-11 polyprotein n=1 Tax=Elysia marginata TaxID=1093978 RepID=A0AAV4ET89_9GAST|nr:transposon Tf2-11 polyprotein [Elysia marginata]